MSLNCDGHTFRPCPGCNRLACATCSSLHHRVRDAEDRLWHRPCAERAGVEFTLWPGLAAIRVEREERGQLVLDAGGEIG